MKKISEVEEKQFASSLNICPEACCRGYGGERSNPSHPHPIFQLICGNFLYRRRDSYSPRRCLHHASFPLSQFLIHPLWLCCLAGGTQPEMEFLDIHLTKDLSLLLHAIHSHLCWRILKTTILYSGLITLTKSTKQENSNLFMNNIL